MSEPRAPRYLTPAPVREENPHITVITGLEGPLPRPAPPALPEEPQLSDEPHLSDGARPDDPDLAPEPIPDAP